MRAFRCLSGQRVMWSFGYVSLLNECNVECLQCSLWFGLLITRVDVCAGQAHGWDGRVQCGLSVSMVCASMSFTVVSWSCP